MSLKDAIRQAVDERESQAKGEDTEVITVGDATPKQEVTNQIVNNEPSVSTTVPTKSTRAKKPTQVTPTHSETPKPLKLSGTVRSKAVNTASSKAVPSPSSELEQENSDIEMAALTIRVPRAHRLHWLISAKKDDTSLTAAITEALNARFGEPTD